MTKFSKDAYNPKEIEKKWYSFWEKNKFFQADNTSSKKSYCIILPPPNVTGTLHMGHALVDTIQDILIRYKRMQGFEALWVPGTDHAGISTQTVVEKHLITTTGKRRKEHTREEFLSHIWAWKEEKEMKILEQIQKLGCSCDWSRLRFTMDEKSNKAVRVMFKKLYDANLIYQGDYLVNWDSITQTALADDEVEYEEKDSYLWYFKYPIADSNEHITIATTRPETMLGDTAVAVSQKDKRYSKYIGKEVLLPLVNRKIPIIADPFVDPEFGTGAVKITPAHDFNDYQMAQRHNLEMINIMTPDGKIIEEIKEFSNSPMLEAREAVIKRLKELSLLEKTEPYKLRVGVSYRSKAIIEPYLSKQWFIKMSPFKQKLIDAVKENKVKLIPKYWENTYYHWIENLRDWCISRQLWWGHRIPIWYNKEDPSKIICYDGTDDPEEIKKDPTKWQQEEDVLDTWFSSALWPFSTLGWPNKTEDLKKFYPTSVLVTGHDILFFWVARMIMMGEYAMEDIPFQKAYVHGLIYGKSYWRVDKKNVIHYVPYEEKVKYDMGEKIPKDVFSKWEKMSKSKGNIIDPTEIIDIYGTDAMRFALSSSVTNSRQIDLDRRRFEEYKNFANKIWNATRFIFMHLFDLEKPLTEKQFLEGLDFTLFTLEDAWILSQLNKTISEVTKNLDNFFFDKAATSSYDFFWNKFCSYYLELVKPSLFGKLSSSLRTNRQKILLIVLCKVIRLFHPIAPFITEEIFSLIKEQFKDIKLETNTDDYTKRTIKGFFEKQACIVSSFPQSQATDSDADDKFEKMTKVIYAIRNIRAEMQIPVHEEISIIISGKNQFFNLIKENEQMILSLIKKVKEIKYLEEKDIPQTASIAIVEGVTIAIPLSKKFLENEKIRLQKEKEKFLKTIQSTQNNLKNKSFLEKAPKEVIEKMQKTLHETKEQLEEIEKKLK